MLVVILVALLFFAVKHFQKRETTSPKETLFVSTPINDTFWLKLRRRNVDRYRRQLKAAPSQVLVVRESHYAFNPRNGIGTHYGWLDGRLANLHVSFSELVGYAYGMNETHTEFPEKWTQGQWTNCYDVICTVTNQPQEALQTAARKFLKQQYGLAWHLETTNTDVLLIRVTDSQLLQSKATTDFARSKSIHEFAGELENYFNKPVIDETGATNRYDKAIGEVPSRWVNGRTTDLDANNEFLTQYGLELVSTNCPQKWLVMDKAN